MKKFLYIVDKIVDKIENNKEYLTELDRQIGDGDHGFNLSRGALKIKENISSFENLKSHEILTKMAILLLSNVGGASGALYSTALMKIATEVKKKEKIEVSDIPVIFGEMIEGIKGRGKAIQGEKTMLDTLIPAWETLQTEVLEEKSLKDMFVNAVKKAREGMESTKNIKATKGRASYLGDRSIGVLDPGAVSSYYILETIAEELKEEIC